MKAVRQFGVLVLLLVSCLASAMACMVPNAEMSAQERACCRMMKNQCGQMGMPSSRFARLLELCDLALRNFA